MFLKDRRRRENKIAKIAESMEKKRGVLKTQQLAIACMEVHPKSRLLWGGGRTSRIREQRKLGKGRSPFSKGNG
jgi:hypothetical protein